MTQTPSEIYLTAERYFALADQGVLGPEDRVELLEGVLVAMSPQDPLHASAVSAAYEALRKALGDQALVRSQLPLVLSSKSVPEPDVAVVSGTRADYETRHPTSAFLVVEVAWSSLAQDRITKGRMYAAAGVPEYWIVNLRDDFIELFRSPDPATRSYGDYRIAHRGERLELAQLRGTFVEVSDLLPVSRPA